MVQAGSLKKKRAERAFHLVERALPHTLSNVGCAASQVWTMETNGQPLA